MSTIILCIYKEIPGTPKFYLDSKYILGMTTNSNQNSFRKGRIIIAKLKNLFWKKTNFEF